MKIEEKTNKLHVFQWAGKKDPWISVESIQEEARKSFLKLNFQHFTLVIEDEAEHDVTKQGFDAAFDFLDHFITSRT